MSNVALILTKACNHYRLYNGKAAETELKNLLESASLSFSFAKDLFKHNLVVFQNGEAALQTLPPLVDVIPEARLNLVIYYLKQGNIAEAHELMKDIDPSQPNEYILKACVFKALGKYSSLSHRHFGLGFVQSWVWTQTQTQAQNSISKTDSESAENSASNCVFEIF